MDTIDATSDATWKATWNVTWKTICDATYGATKDDLEEIVK